MDRLKSWRTPLTAFLVLGALTASQAAEQQRMEGELEAYVVDYPVDDGSTSELAAQGSDRGQALRAEMRYYLRLDDGSRVTLNPGESGALDAMTTGDRVQVRGYVTETSPMTRDNDERSARQQQTVTASEGQRRMRVREAQPMTSRNTRAEATGSVAASHDDGSVEKRRALGVRIEFNGPEDAVSRKAARSALFDGSKSSDAFYRIASGGDASGGGQFGVLPPSGAGKDTVKVSLDRDPSGCGWRGWEASARAKAKDKGVDFSKHEHTVFFLPKGATSGCRWLGKALLGGDLSWVRGSGAHTTGHELGHNFGLRHTNRADGGDVESYDEWTLMGWRYSFINPVQREFLGFYDDHPDKIETVEAGERTIDMAGLNASYDGSKPHAIKVPMDDGGTYYAYLIDEDPGGSKGGRIGSVVITTPRQGKSGSLQRDRIRVGDEFKDSGNDIRIRMESQGGDSAKLTVRNGEPELGAQDTQWTMAPGKEHEGELTANNVGDRSLSFNKVSSPSQGEVSFNGEGSFTYTANGDASGEDSFTYRAVADGVKSEPAEATVTLNQSPQVGDISKSVTAGETVKGELDVSDKESEPGKLALEITDKPDKGTVSLTEGTQFVYKANDDASGSDSFRYQARDSFSSSSKGKVAVQIESDADGGGSGGSSDSGSSSSDSGGDFGSSDSGSSGDSSDGGGGGAIGWLNLVGLLGMALAACRPRRALAAGGAHD